MNWNEVIKKENKSSKIYDTFSLNPKHCSLVVMKCRCILRSLTISNPETKRKRRTRRRRILRWRSSKVCSP